MTKAKQNSESKIINLFYNLYRRLLDSESQWRIKMQAIYVDIIEEKDYKINNLEIRLNTAMSHLKRIEEDKIRLK